MNDEIKSLIESLRRGNFDDPAEKIALLAASLRQPEADVSFLLHLLNAPQIPLRLAGLEAVMSREEKVLHDAVLSLVQDRETRVRVKTAEVLGSFPKAISGEALKTLASDSESEVRVAAVKAGSAGLEFFELHRSVLAFDPSWVVRMEAAKSLDQLDDPRVLSDLMGALAKESDTDVQRFCAESLERRLEGQEVATLKHLAGDIALLHKMECELKLLGGRYTKLSEWVHSHTTVAVDPELLGKFGTNLTEMAASGLLPRAYCAEEACASLIKLVQRDPYRSIVLLGESGVGKSALVNELVHQLAKPDQGGWHVLRVSPTDFMVGTKYTGEWETKVVELVKAVRKPKRVVVYVPNLADLAAMGRWSKSDANVATALAPYLEEGSILLLGESTPDEFERGFGTIPSLQRLFDKVRISESDAHDTRSVLHGVREESEANISDEVLVQLQEVSDYYLSHLRRPGNAATLLRAVIGAQGEPGREISFGDVLATLSQSSGVPARLLDDQVPLDPEKVRAFFDQRVIGQPGPVNAVVNLITLIKAGLTDPNKPFGVLMLVGPTGVGKTELARALAEFIFGDVKRLLRFDMSEFSSPDGFQRLIGGRGENGLLTDAIRQQPFSVVLFDEIEKSHLNVFDLCLQIFDAGRLTDGRGRLVDFRRAIVILTSNIGSQLPGTPLGFGSAPPANVPDVDPDRTWRELTRFFRPEFLNRIDRIVHFNPLSLDVAERIAIREVDLVLRRSGVARRGLKVHVDPSVIAFLVREGYSPHFGARPLKRTVEQQLLIPLAEKIASGHTADSDVITATVVNGRISMQATKRAASVPAASAEPARRSTLQVQLDDLGERLAVLHGHIQPLHDRKSELLALTSESGFYRDPVKRAATFDEIQKLDRFLELVGSLDRSSSAIARRLAGKPPRSGSEEELLERVEALATNVAYAESIAVAQDARDLADALVALTRVNHEGATLSGVEKLAGIYRIFSERHRLAVQFLAERFDEKMDQAFLSVNGLGACALFEREAGLHKFDRRMRRSSTRTGREKAMKDSELVQVEVFPVCGEPDKDFIASVNTDIRELKSRHARLVENARWQVRLFHPASVRSLETWTAGTRDEALDTTMNILNTQVDSADSRPVNEVIRHYELGIGSKIKDNRSGRSTTRIAQVFKGHIEHLRG